MSISSVLAYDIPAAPRGGYRALGYNPAVGATAEGVWGGGGAMNLTMGSGAVKVSSSSANDTSAGTGARTVRVFGIVAGVATSEDAILNGDTTASHGDTGIAAWNPNGRWGGSSSPRRARRSAWAISPALRRRRWGSRTSAARHTASTWAGT